FLDLNGFSDTFGFLNYDVGNTNDDGPGSLRLGIITSNNTGGLAFIGFQIGSGAQRIEPTSPLPVITDPVIIDGTTQPGYADSPLIELNGSEAGFGADGFVITAGDSVIRGLAINQFTSIGFFGEGGVRGGRAIVLSGNGGNRIEGNYIGTDLT